MSFYIAIKFLFLQIFLNQHYVINSCNSFSRINTISFVNYHGIAYVLTSNGFYYIIKDEDIENNSNEYRISGKIPDILTNCCDSSVVKDVECETEDPFEHSIAFLKHSSGQSKYISARISSLSDDDNGIEWSKAKPVNNDIILSNANIDYTQKINAIFNTDNAGEIFFIQGEFYSGIEFNERCPQVKDDIITYEKRPLSELNVFGNIDSAYYEESKSGEHYIYLLHYDHMQYYKVKIDRQNSKNGKFVSFITTKHPISSHPIISKICRHNQQYNSSLLSAEQPSIDITYSTSTITFPYSSSTIAMSLLSYGYLKLFP